MQFLHECNFYPLSRVPPFGCIAFGNGNGLQATLPPFQSGLGLVCVGINKNRSEVEDEIKAYEKNKQGMFVISLQMMQFT